MIGVDTPDNVSMIWDLNPDVMNTERSITQIPAAIPICAILVMVPVVVKDPLDPKILLAMYSSVFI